MVPSNNSLYKTIQKASEEQGWRNAPGLLLAVSGGSDSMALLSLVRRCYEGRLVVAHLEHGFRGASSLADAAFVEDHCRRVGLPCFVRHADVPNNMKKGESFEMAGRRARYEFFYELLEHEKLSFIATGHTADDTIETMLFHLFRGTGLKGLSGIAPVRGRIVRPLIGCRREELRKFLADEGIPWREDESNDEDHFKRNKIRNQLLPWVRANLNEAPERVLLGLAAQAAEVERESGEKALRVLPWVRRRHPFALAAWDTAVAQGLDDARLAALLRAQGATLGLPLLDRERVEQLRSLIRKSGRWRFQWSGEVEVCGARSLIGWIERRDLDSPGELSVDLAALPGGERQTVRWGRWRIELERENCPSTWRDGLWQSRIWPDSSGKLRISSAEADFAGGVRAEKIPWWSLAGWPMIGNWIPGWEKCVQEESSYVMIAKVFCEHASSTK